MPGYLLCIAPPNPKPHVLSIPITPVLAFGGQSQQDLSGSKVSYLSHKNRVPHLVELSQGIRVESNKVGHVMFLSGLCTCAHGCMYSDNYVHTHLYITHMYMLYVHLQVYIYIYMKHIIWIL